MIFGGVVTAAISYLGWDKRQDKLKMKEMSDDITDLKIELGRQDEKQSAMSDTIGLIREDTKEIKHILMERN